MKKSYKITISRALSCSVVNDMIGDYTNIGEGAEELRTLLLLKGIDYDNTTMSRYPLNTTRSMVRAGYIMGVLING